MLSNLYVLLISADEFQNIPFGAERNQLLQQKWNKLTDEAKSDHNARACANFYNHGEGNNLKALVTLSMNRIKKEVCNKSLDWNTVHFYNRQIGS